MTDKEVMQIINFLMNDKKFIIYLMGCCLVGSLWVHILQEFSNWLLDTFTSFFASIRSKK